MKVNKITWHAICLIIVIALAPSIAFGYVGPGAGITLLGVIWAVIAAIGMTIAGVLVWPVRILLRRLASNRHPKTHNQNEFNTKSKERA